MRPQVADIKVPETAVRNGEALQAIAELHVWGGMHHSIKADEDGDVSAGFDPSTADGGIMGIVAWLDGLGCEWTMTISAWERD